MLKWSPRQLSSLDFGFDVLYTMTPHKHEQPPLRWLTAQNSEVDAVHGDCG